MAESAGRYRWSLADGLVLVLGLSVVLASFRPGLAAWPSGSLGDIVARVIGLSVMALVAWMIVMAVPALVVAGRRPGGTAWARPRSMAALLALLAALAFLAGEQMQVWDEVERSRLATSAGRIWVSDASLRGRENLVPVAGLLLLSGVVLAMRPGRLATAPHPSRPVADRVRLVLALVVGTLFLAGFMLIPYLVLNAIEAVRNAQKPNWAAPRIALAERLDAAGLAGLVGLILCLLVADWLARDLRGSSRPTRPGLAWRGLTFLAMVGWLGWIVGVGLDRLHPWLVRGLSLTVTPRVTALIATGLGGLAAGIVARAVAGDEGREEGPARRWPAPVAIGALALVTLIWVAGEVILQVRPDLAPQALTRPMMTEPEPPSLVEQAIRALAEIFSHLQPPAPLLLVAPLWIWLAWRIPKRVGDAWQPRSPLVVVASEGGKARRFLAYWLALLTLMMAAIPAFGLAALAVMHRRIQDVGSLGDAVLRLGLW
ncbi:MAG: hypothetical protein U0800_12800 [Isosphaeraceae bacterium]